MRKRLKKKKDKQNKEKQKNKKVDQQSEQDMVANKPIYDSTHEK